ncbi:uncharacterized protein [Neodiprion pinetum]|uniref:uncharacterized protein n=1 Tax=Neodiprion pinetum TaxID=441929 RepID=UPI00371B0E8D
MTRHGHAAERNATRTDLSRCKLTQLGTDYMGSITTTAGGIRCQMWYSEKPLHQVHSYCTVTTFCYLFMLESITDKVFPERSLRLVRNYCRNPTKDPRGPWCYTMDPNLIDDECEVPLCNFGGEHLGVHPISLHLTTIPRCSIQFGASVQLMLYISGTGSEYGGTRETSSSGRKCNSWDKRLKLAINKTEKFPSNYFSDLSRNKAKNFCRNPDSSAGGPWCYVDSESYDIVEKEYCSVPFCDDKGSYCLVYTKNASTYSILTSLNSTIGNITFWVKLWNPGDEQIGQARLLLSNLQVPSSAEMIAQKWGTGVEILISNSGSGQEYPRTDGMAIQMFWHRDYGREKVFSIRDDAIQTVRWFSIGSENTIAHWTLFCTPTEENAVEAPWFPNCISNSADSRYEGTQWMAEGEVPCVPWIFDKIPKEDRVDDHFIDGSALKALNKCRNPTNDPEGPYCYTLQDFRSSSVEKQYCSIRKCRSSECRMAGTANDYIGTMSVTRSGRTCAPWWTGYNQTNVTTEKTPSFKSLMVKALTSLKFKRENALKDNLLDTPSEPWDKIGLRYGLRKDFDFGHTSRRVARSYKQSEVDQLIRPHRHPINLDTRGTLESVGDGDWLRSNLSTRQVLARYNLVSLNRRLLQEQDTSKKANLHPIFNPYQEIEEITTELNEKDEFFNMVRETVPQEDIPSTTSESYNSISPNSPYDETSKFTSELPGSPDFLTVHSSLTTTLPTIGATFEKPEVDGFSHTTASPQPKTGSTEKPSKPHDHKKPIHPVDPLYLNDTLYPEQNVKSASNFCRNPSRNIAGAWCYTTDPEVPQDLCNVRDCEQPEECIFLVRGHGSGRRLYVLPDYRSEGLQFSLKEWEPDRPDSITFAILGEDDVKSRLILKVGAMKNEKVLLYYETEGKAMKLVKEKTLPHLLYLGKWTGFVIRMERGGIKLYYEGAPYPLFEWEDPEPAKAFLPVYYYYSSEIGNTIGVAFKCNTSIYIETTTDRFTRILPISIWETEETPSPHRLVLMVRGQGVILLPLLMLPTMPVYYALTIGEKGHWVFFMKNKLPAVHILHKQNAKGQLFNFNTWTNLTIQFYDYTIKVLRNGTEVFHYDHNLPLLFYFFSLAVDKDIDGSPVDGGWSEWGPWRCSATCNGGIGVRKRVCNNPEPNIRGQPCLGPSTSSGRCNMNKCDDVTEVTLELVKRKIRTQHTSLIVKEGDRVKLLADPDIVSALRNETPKSDINWSRNGIFLEEEEDRIKLEDTAVSISYTVVNDSGVYTQTLHRVDDTRLIFKIITLAVIPVTNELVTRETLSFSMTCHCVVLGYVYSDLKISWKLNGQVFKDYGVSTPVAVNADRVRKVNKSHRGEWRCEVEQKDLNFKWTTNAIKVRVLGPPNWRTHLMDDKLTRPIFGWMPNESFVAFSAFLLTFLIIAAIIASTITYLRFRESLKYKAPLTEKLIDSEESFNDSGSENLIDDKKR